MELRSRVTRRSFLKIAAGAVAGAALAGGGANSVAFANGRQAADEAWNAAHFSKLENAGKVTHLSILPLVDWYPGRDGLVGEPGLSYLIRADAKTILLDVGLNLRQEHPSPLLRNAGA